MTKNERIKENQREIEALRDQIAELRARVVVLEAMEEQLPLPLIDLNALWYPRFGNINTEPLCACGLTAGGACPAHGMRWSA